MGSHGPKVIAEIDEEIINYYKSFIPKYYEIRPQKYNAHISVIRKEKLNMDNWGKREGQEIKFYYTNIIYCNKFYYWLNCFSKELENIREEMGLSLIVPKELPQPPGGWKWIFHTTIGNKKELALSQTKETNV